MSKDLINHLESLSSKDLEVVNKVENIYHPDRATSLSAAIGQILYERQNIENIELFFKDISKRFQDPIIERFKEGLR